MKLLNTLSSWFGLERTDRGGKKSRRRRSRGFESPAASQSIGRSVSVRRNQGYVLVLEVDAALATATATCCWLLSPLLGEAAHAWSLI